MNFQDPFQIEFPKFLVGYPDEGDEREYVIHLHRPQFVATVYESEEGEVELVPTYIDTPSDHLVGTPEQVNQQLEQLLDEAAEWYTIQFDEVDEEDD